MLMGVSHKKLKIKTKKVWFGHSSGWAGWRKTFSTFHVLLAQGTGGCTCVCCCMFCGWFGPSLSTVRCESASEPKFRLSRCGRSLLGPGEGAGSDEHRQSACCFRQMQMTSNDNFTQTSGGHRGSSVSKRGTSQSADLGWRCERREM